LPPTSADGIEKYLSSGMIRGIGPANAMKLLRAFGEKVNAIQTTPERLREVDGIGPVRAASIVAARTAWRRRVSGGDKEAARATTILRKWSRASGMVGCERQPPA
jgi:ERCC4-type nuclease